MSEVITVAKLEGVTWQLTARLRYARPDHTTTLPDRLQQMWWGSNGEERWEDVPLVVLPTPPPDRPAGSGLDYQGTRGLFGYGER